MCFSFSPESGALLDVVDPRVSGISESERGEKKKKKEKKKKNIYIYISVLGEKSLSILFRARSTKGEREA